MLKTLLGVVVELAAALAIGGLILAVAVPLVTRSGLGGTDDIATRAVVTAVLAAAVAVAIFRPGSAIRRRMQR